MNKVLQRLGAFAVSVFLLLGGSQPGAVAEEGKQTNFLEIAQGIINWKKLDNGSTVDGYLINNAFLEQAGSTPGDWFPIGDVYKRQPTLQRMFLTRRVWW